MRCLLILALATVVTGDSMTRTITLHGNEDLGKILEETMPKKCTKNGKEYEVNEEFASGHLRYKCGKYGVYTIEGCRTEKGHDMAVGDRHVDDNVLSQCFKKGGSIYYRTTVCGTMGMPECDSIKPDSPLMGSSGIQESGSVSRTLTTGDLKKLPDAQGLPFGWHVLEEKKSNAPNTNVQLTSRTLIFNPTQ
ncbi:unnamed protein product, partial [Mesorhabditis spiculigera]